MARPRTACAMFYILFMSVLFLSSDARQQRVYTTGIADIVRTAFKRGLNRFISRQTAYDSDVFRYTQASQRGYGGLFAGESCRLSPMICSYDEQCCSGRCLCRRWPHCTNDLRRHFEPSTTTKERHVLKKHLQQHMSLRVRLINYQRLLFSAYQRQSIRFKHQLYIDQQTSDKYGFVILRSNPNMLIVNEQRFVRASTSAGQHQQSLQCQIAVHSEPEALITSTENIESQIERLDVIMIKLNTCSTLIATGHGRTMPVSSLPHIDTEHVKEETVDEEISLSKTSRKTSHRLLLRRQVKAAVSHTYSFATSDTISPNEF